MIWHGMDGGWFSSENLIDILQLILALPLIYDGVLNLWYGAMGASDLPSPDARLIRLIRMMMSLSRLHILRGRKRNISVYYLPRAWRKYQLSPTLSSSNICINIRGYLASSFLDSYAYHLYLSITSMRTACGISKQQHHGLTIRPTYEIERRDVYHSR